MYGPLVIADLGIILPGFISLSTESLAAFFLTTALPIWAFDTFAIIISF
jgi:hypothetical protein